MGWIADVSTMALGFIVPLVCFGYIVFFGLKGYKATSANKALQTEI
jgi:fucose permease